MDDDLDRSSRRHVLKMSGALLTGGAVGATNASADPENEDATVSASTTTPRYGESVTFSFDWTPSDVDVDFKWDYFDPDNNLEFETNPLEEYDDDLRSNRYLNTSDGTTVTENTVTLTTDDVVREDGEVPVETPLRVSVYIPQWNVVGETTVVWMSKPNEPPTADIAVQDDGRTGGPVTFDSAGSSDLESDSVDQEWSFSPPAGDRTVTSEEPVVSTDIRAPGTYDVSLTVSDRRGATDTTTTEYTVPSDETPPGIESGQKYKLLNLQSSAALDIAGGSGGNGANAQVWGYTGGENQQWRIESAGDGYYKLVNADTGKVLDVSGVSQENGANVHQWEDVGSENQQWKIEQTQPGVYRLIARHSGKALEASGFEADDGTTVDQWDYGGGATQQWALLPVDSDDSWYTDEPGDLVDTDMGLFYGSARFTVTNNGFSPVAVNPTVVYNEEANGEQKVVDPYRSDSLVLPGSTREFYVSVDDIPYFMMVLRVNGDAVTVAGKYT